MPRNGSGYFPWRMRRKLSFLLAPELAEQRAERWAPRWQRGRREPRRLLHPTAERRKVGAGQTPQPLLLGLGACLGHLWAVLGNEGLCTRRGNSGTVACGTGSGGVLGAVALMCVGAAEHICDGGAPGV